MACRSFLDTEEVRGSNPRAPTRTFPHFRVGFLCWPGWLSGLISASFRGQRAHSGHILRRSGLSPCPVEAFGQGLIDAFVEVAVGVEGRLDRGVTEAHLNRLQVGLLTDEHDRMRLPQVATHTSVLELRYGKTRRQRRAPADPRRTHRDDNPGRANGPNSARATPQAEGPFGVTR